MHGPRSTGNKHQNSQHIVFSERRDLGRIRLGQRRLRPAQNLHLNIFGRVVRNEEHKEIIRIGR
jgi:hypothetical protein